MKGLLGTIATAMCLLLSNQAMAATQYEAENATLSGGANKNTNHTGYTGSGFVDGFFNSTTALATFTVSAPSAGSATVTLRYSAGNGTSSNTGLYVNGAKLRNSTCNTTSNWDTWANKIETVTLNAGNNTIGFKAETSSGSCINIDYISVQTAASHTVTFNKNDAAATGTMAAQTINEGATAALTSNAFTKAGSTFMGWATSSTGSVVYANSANFTMGSVDVTLYAKWTTVSHTVTFNKNDAAATGTMAGQTINEGATAALTSNAFTKAGSTFAGWATSSTGSVAYANGASFTMGNVDVTLYAKWTSVYHTVTFDKNDASATGSMAAQTIAEGATAALTSNAFSKAGSTFAGWATSASGTVAYVNGASYTMGAVNVTLYAKWTTNSTLTLTITSDANGTTNPTGAVTVNVGSSTQIIALPNSGYQLSHWSVVSGTASLSSPTSAITMVSTPGGDVTLRANFVVATPTGVSAVTYAEISSPVAVNAANTIVLQLPFTAPSAGYITVTATGLYGTSRTYTHEQRGLESFITLNATTGGALSGLVDKPNVQNSAQYVSETAGFYVAAGANTVRLIVTPRTTLSTTAYSFVKCKMTVVFSTLKM